MKMFQFQAVTLQDVPSIAVFKDGSYSIYDGENSFKRSQTGFNEACGHVSDVTGFLSAPLEWFRPSSAVEGAGSEKPERPSRGSPGKG